MKQVKRMIMIILVTIIMVTSDYTPVFSASVAGKTETNAIELKSGKKKTTKFWTGSEDSLFYVVALPEQGTLSVSITAESLGTSATIQIRKTDNVVWSESKTFSYNKKKKTTSGTLKSAYILPKGNYIVQITPGKKINKTKKVTVIAKFSASKFTDKERNDSEDSAQEIEIYGNIPTYKMYLNCMTLFEEEDLTDCMKFTTKDVETIRIELKSKANMDNVKLLVREKNGDIYNTVKMYNIVNGKVSEKIRLPKGTYYIKVWCSDPATKNQMPYTIKCKVE